MDEQVFGNNPVKIFDGCCVPALRFWKMRDAPAKTAGMCNRKSLSGKRARETVTAHLRKANSSVLEGGKYHQYARQGYPRNQHGIVDGYGNSMQYPTLEEQPAYGPHDICCTLISSSDHQQVTSPHPFVRREQIAPGYPQKDREQANAPHQRPCER